MARENGFEQFMELRKQASDEFINGNFGPLGHISAQRSPATLFGPRGNCVQGADHVNATNAKGAQRFKPGGSNTFEVMHMAADDEMAYWVGIQRSIVNMDGQASSVTFDLRVTEIFRREGTEWKLVHRHADKLAAD